MSPCEEVGHCDRIQGLWAHHMRSIVRFLRPTDPWREDLWGGEAAPEVARLGVLHLEGEEETRRCSRARVYQTA